MPETQEGAIFAESNADAEETAGEVSTKSEGNRVDDAVAEGGNSPSSEKNSEPKVPENRNAIPTAGGERLGERHWGETEVVPNGAQHHARGQPTRGKDQAQEGKGTQSDAASPGTHEPSDLIARKVGRERDVVGTIKRKLFRRLTKGGKD